MVETNKEKTETDNEKKNGQTKGEEEWGDDGCEEGKEERN